jgi:hypothetical protein
MSFQVNTAFVQQYSTAVMMLLQQSESRFEAAVQVRPFYGKAASVVEQFGQTNATRITSRHADTVLSSTPHDKRWVFPLDYGWAELTDEQDLARMLITPGNMYIAGGAAAMKRVMDDEILSGFFNSNKTGENGSLDTGLLSAANGGSQVVPVNTGSSANTGLNIAKLRAAKRILLQAEVDVDSDPLFMAISAKQHDDLLNEAQAISLDYGNTPVLEQGRIKSFMGFNFIPSERIPGAGAYNAGMNPALTVPVGQNWVPFWAKSGVCLGKWNELTAKVGERADKNHAEQVALRMTLGATRLEEKRCGYIVCV